MTTSAPPEGAPASEAPASEASSPRPVRHSPGTIQICARPPGLVGSRLGPAGSQGAKTLTPYLPRANRAPLRAGLLVLFLAAGVSVGGRWLRASEPIEVSPSIERSTPAVGATSNVRARPDASAPVVAVLPSGRQPEVVGRLAEGDWLLVVFGLGESERGWLPADRLGLPRDAIVALPTVAAPEAAPAPEAPAPSGLPDLVIGSVFLMRDGHIALEIRNDGTGPLTDAKIPVLVTRASGETVGVLEVGPATLAPRGTATVVTPVVVTGTGTYTLQLDRQESIAEASRDNNSATKLLVGGG